MRAFGSGERAGNPAPDCARAASGSDRTQSSRSASALEENVAISLLFEVVDGDVNQNFRDGQLDNVRNRSYTKVLRKSQGKIIKI